ncbi:hypothetical protein KAR34_12935 [bacterium]|nr:hypothetical protein [bacterium]
MQTKKSKKGPDAEVADWGNKSESAQKGDLLIFGGIMETLMTVIISGIISFITALAVVKHQRKAEREKRSFETLYSEYKSYLQLVGKSNIVVTKSFEEYLNKVGAIFPKILSGDVEAVDLLNEYLRNYLKGFVKYLSEIEGSFVSVGLVCSESVLQSQEKFISCMKDLFNKVSALPKGNQLDSSNAARVEKELSDAGKEIEKISNELIRNMRVDIQRFLGNEK